MAEFINWLFETPTTAELCGQVRCMSEIEYHLQTVFWGIVLLLIVIKLVVPSFWSYGVLWYRVLTDQSPFDSQQTPEHKRRRRERNKMRLRQHEWERLRRRGQ